MVCFDFSKIIFWAMPLGFFLIDESVIASVQQNLHYGIVPSTSAYQFGETTKIDNIAGLDDGSGSIKFATPYSLSNTSSSGSQKILVKVVSDLPSTVALKVSIDQSTGLSTDGQVNMDGTDRSLVSNLQHGSYSGQLHYQIDGELTNAKGDIRVTYTLNSS